MKKELFLTLSFLIVAFLIGCTPSEPAPPVKDSQQVEDQVDIVAEETVEEPEEVPEVFEEVETVEELAEVEEPVEEPEEVVIKEPIEEVSSFKSGFTAKILQDFNVRIEVEPRWSSLGIIDPNYYPETTLYEGWYENWRNQIRIGLIHNIGENIDLKDFDAVTEYYEDSLRQWCAGTIENPVFEVAPTEEGWTQCLEMGKFTFKEITIDGRQAYHVKYDWKDEFRLPDGELTKDIYSGWITWTNLIPHGDDLILVSGYTIVENVDSKQDSLLYSINSFKILNDAKPVFEST